MIEPNTFIKNWLETLELEDKLAQQVEANSPYDIYAFGINEQTELLCQQLTLDGVIDDYRSEISWNNIPVYKSTEVLNKPLIINCSLSINPSSAWKIINSLTDKALSYFNMHKLNRLKYPLPLLLEQRKQDILSNLLQWQKIANTLEDESSKELLDNFIRFSMTSDYRYYGEYKTMLSNQYFEPFMAYQEEIFIDAGGYIGDTSLEFVKHDTHYKKIYLFEPSKQNIEQAKLNLANKTNIEFIEKGLGAKAGKTMFNAKLGSSSAVASSGETEIEITSLDQTVTDRVTFIKMDLEGAEYDALIGSLNTIRNNTPKLAIAVYHKGNDIWKLADLILKTNPNYSLRLRQYTEGWSETVMYFIPKH